MITKRTMNQRIAFWFLALALLFPCVINNRSSLYQFASSVYGIGDQLGNASIHIVEFAKNNLMILYPIGIIGFVWFISRDRLNISERNQFMVLVGLRILFEVGMRIAYDSTFIYIAIIRCLPIVSIIILFKLFKLYKNSGIHYILYSFLIYLVLTLSYAVSSMLYLTNGIGNSYYMQDRLWTISSVILFVLYVLMLMFHNYRVPVKNTKTAYISSCPGCGKVYVEAVSSCNACTVEFPREKITIRQEDHGLRNSYSIVWLIIGLTNHLIGLIALIIATRRAPRKSTSAGLGILLAVVSAISYSILYVLFA